MFRRCEDDLCMIMKFISSSPIVYLAANTFQQLNQPSVVSIAQNLVFGINRWDNSYTCNDFSRSIFNFIRLKCCSFQDDKEPIFSWQPATKCVEHEWQGGVRAAPASGTASDCGPSDRLGQPHSPHSPQTSRGPLRPSSHNRLEQFRPHHWFAVHLRLRLSGLQFPSYRLGFGWGNNLESYKFYGDYLSAKVRQVVYGHGDVVSCIARSETSLFADCYIATGSFDCTIALWHWNGHVRQFSRFNKSRLFIHSVSLENISSISSKNTFLKTKNWKSYPRLCNDKCQFTQQKEMNQKTIHKK